MWPGPVPGHTCLCQAEEVHLTPRPPAATTQRPATGPFPAHSGHGQLMIAGSPFTAAELLAMESAGLVRPLLGGLYRASAQPLTLELRAEAVLTILGPVLAGRWCAIGRTASWVLLGGVAPPQLEAAVSHFHRRPSHAVAMPLSLRQLDVAAAEGHEPDAAQDVVQLHGLRCTTVERTLEDLLRETATSALDVDHHHTVQSLAALCTPRSLRERFERRRRLPGMLLARERLEAVLPPPVSPD